MTEAEVYDALKSGLEPNERIFIDMGVPNPQGGYYRHPILDDYGNRRLEKFYINPRQAHSRLQSLIENGWQPYEPQPAPKAVKRTKKRTAKSST